MISTELSNYLFNILEDLQKTFQEQDSLQNKPFIYFEVTSNQEQNTDSQYEINLHIDFESEKEPNQNEIILPKFKKIKEDDILVLENCECSICLEKYTSGTYKRTLDCNHSYHKKCIDKWFKNSTFCPLCKKEYA